jgi:hypothetical protein
MNINTHFYVNWWHDWVRRHKGSPHRMKNITDYARAHCLHKILQQIEKADRRLPQLNFRLQKQWADRLSTGIDVDDFNVTTVTPEPIYAPKQIARIQIRFWSNFILLLLFTAAESVLFTVTASTYMRQSPLPLQILVGTSFAVGIMFAFSYNLSSYKHYLEALDLKAKKVTENGLKWYRFKYILGIVSTLFVFIAVALAGVARMYYFEHIDPSGMTPDEFKLIQLATKYAGWFSLIVGIPITIFVGFMKHTFTKVAVDYFHYRKMNSASKSMASNTDEFIKYAKFILMEARQQALYYWLSVLNVKGQIHEGEIDVKYRELNERYMFLRMQPGFVVTNEIYRRYRLIQSSFEELFVYGIVHDDLITDKINEAAAMLQIPKEQAAEYIRQIEETKANCKLPTFSSNGHSKNEVTFTTKTGINTILGLIIVTGMMFASCKDSNKITRLPHNIVTGADISGSRTPANVLWYKEIVEQHILTNAGMKDRVIVLPIDAGSLQASEEILYLDFASNSYYNQSAGQNQDLVQKRLHHDSIVVGQHRFSLAFDSALVHRMNFSGGTDIVGTLQVVQKYLLPGHDNVVILLSDMLLDANFGSGRVNFESNVLNDTSDLSSMLTKVPVVNLSGWKVIVLTGAQTKIPSAKYMAVRTFYERYFSKCGANLLGYSSETVSMIDAELAK